MKIRQFVALISQQLLQPRFPKIKSIELESLGSVYGGKVFSPVNLKGSTVLSAGCGEDISFDVELARAFDLRVILIDPVPRSIAHVKQVLGRIGEASQEEFMPNSGKQDVRAYNLEGLRADQFVFIERALFNFVGTISLFPPMDASHISHSFLDLHQTKTLSGYSEIRVASTTVKAVLDELSFEKISLLKLDIEGAQLEVLGSMFADNIFPDQILVEIDELHFPSLKSRRRAKSCLKLLKNNQYELVARENKYDFTFVRRDLIEQTL